MRIPPESHLDLQFQAIHPAPHVGVPDRNPNAHTRRECDQRRRSSASSTSGSVAGLTSRSTRTRHPLGSSISIVSQTQADALAGGKSGVLVTGTSYGTASTAIPTKCRRQLKSRLVLTSYCRATAETGALGADAAATISRLSGAGHTRRRRLMVSIIPGVDTSTRYSCEAIRLVQTSEPLQAALTGGRLCQRHRAHAGIK